MSAVGSKSHNHPNYMAFISYRHADNKERDSQWASWLHKKLETYQVPPELVGTINDRGDVIPNKIYPVFRDEESLPAHADLTHSITHALNNSQFLVVLCSPGAVESRYVAQEITYFKQQGHHNRIISALITGEPNASRDDSKVVDPDKPETHECFPEPLQYSLNGVGEIDPTLPTEPIAADFRLPNGQRGVTSRKAHKQLLNSLGLSSAEKQRELDLYERQVETAFLKIVAGILGVTPETLRDRHQEHALAVARLERRRARRNLLIVSGLSITLISVGFLAYERNEVAANRLVEIHEKTLEAEAKQLEAETAAKQALQRQQELDEQIERSRILQKDANSAALDAIRFKEDAQKAAQLAEEQRQRAEEQKAAALAASKDAQQKANALAIQERYSQELIEKQLTKAETIFGEGLIFPEIIEHIANGNLFSVERAIAKGTDINLSWNKGSSTPLIAAIAADQFEIAKWLVKSGANVNLITKSNSTALLESIKQSRLTMADWLLENGADINLLTDGVTPVTFAAAFNKPKFIRLFISKGADVNLSASEYAPLPLALAINPLTPPPSKDVFLESIQLLLDAGANVELKGSSDNGTNTQSALFHIYTGRNPAHNDALELLLEAGANPDKDFIGNGTFTPRIFHAHRGDLNALLQYFKFYKNNGQTETKKSLNLMLSALLSSLTKNYLERNELDRTYSNIYSAQDFINIVSLALSKGASPYSVTDDFGSTAFGALISAITSIQSPPVQYELPSQEYLKFIDTVFVKSIKLSVDHKGFDEWAASSRGSFELQACEKSCPDNIKQLLKHRNRS